METQSRSRRKLAENTFPLRFQNHRYIYFILESRTYTWLYVLSDNNYMMDRIQNLLDMTEKTIKKSQSPACLHTAMHIFQKQALLLKESIIFCEKAVS